jgi:hypothetical protein
MFIAIIFFGPVGKKYKTTKTTKQRKQIKKRTKTLFSQK